MKKTILALLLFASLSANAQEPREPQPEGQRRSYTTKQAISERAQLHTIAFDGLAFLTGNFGADTFFPPGKLADFFGFQYMRDNDSNQMGHNTDFLTRIANNVIRILNADQLQQMKDLAKKQEDRYDDFARKRMVLISAFRQYMEAPAGQIALDRSAVRQFLSDLYAIDAALSIERAAMTGSIIHSLSPGQVAAFNALRFTNSDSWPVIPENLDKRSLSHRSHVLVMTYASELFSWYKGSVEADVYFCPERHGTYFGGFYMKDFPAMGNHGYSISTSLTGESGKDFIALLKPAQQHFMKEIPGLQKPHLDSIVEIREMVSKELRKYISDGKPDAALLMKLIRQYGEQDAELSLIYVEAFTAIQHTLTEDQRKALKQLRAQDVLPAGAYLYSDPVPLPERTDHSFLFAKKTTMKAF